MDKRIDKLIDELINLQGELISVDTYGHAGMPKDWHNETTSGRMIGISERVHGGNGVTYDLIIKSTGSGRLWSVALTRIVSFKKGI